MHILALRNGLCYKQTRNLNCRVGTFKVVYYCCKPFGQSTRFSCQLIQIQMCLLTHLDDMLNNISGLSFSCSKKNRTVKNVDWLNCNFNDCIRTSTYSIAPADYGSKSSRQRKGISRTITFSYERSLELELAFSPI